MRCLLIEHEVGLILIETGFGKQGRRASFTTSTGSRTPARMAARCWKMDCGSAGFTPDDIAIVIDTHLHFDHAGGNTYRDEAARFACLSPTPAMSCRRANTITPRTQRAHCGQLLRPQLRAGLRGRAVRSCGRGARDRTRDPRDPHARTHPYHQSVLLESDGEHALVLGDLVPTVAHLPLPWIMGYDVEPLVTLETKRHILARAHERRVAR